ncbi:hypothetical protein [Pseudooceanicola sp.]|uniref:hypothetical protein n=1 Tax=Pseudooceanicola sp. TaxID=1914328 RepID=UPI0035C6AF3F
MLVFWALVVVVGGLYLAMMVLTVPVLLREAGGLKPFDFRPFGYSTEDVNRYLDAISEEGLATYLGLQHQLDLVFPLVLAAMFVVGFRRFLGSVAGLVMSVLAVTGAVADYSENALVATLLTEPVQPEQVVLASTLTIVKSLLATICFVVMIWIGVQAWRARPTRKAPRKGVRKTGARKAGK